MRSPAQNCLAVVVANPELLEIPSDNVGQMKLVNTFCWLDENAEGAVSHAVIPNERFFSEELYQAKNIFFDFGHPRNNLRTFGLGQRWLGKTETTHQKQWDCLYAWPRQKLKGKPFVPRVLQADFGPHMRIAERLYPGFSILMKALIKGTLNCLYTIYEAGRQSKRFDMKHGLPQAVYLEMG